MAGATYDLVQPIVVTATGSHEETVRAVAAASALASVHLDSPAWTPWLEHSFAKTVRRVKNLNRLWRVSDDMRALGHGSFEYSCGGPFAGTAGVYAKAFAPLPAAELPKPVSRLWVSGFDRERSGCWPEMLVHADVMVVLNGGIPMTTGKAAAQAAHALTGWLLAADGEARDRFVTGQSSFRLVEEPTDVFDRLWPHAAAAIADAGHTEVAPGSRTALAVSLPVYEGVVADERR